MIDSLVRADFEDAHHFPLLLLLHVLDLFEAAALLVALGV